jgi:dolichol-phosphate mannosyltransferase
MDGDLSHRPEELPDGIRRIAAGAGDVAIASKYVPGGKVVNRPLGRRLVSRVCSAAVGTLISWRIRDYSNGYRFYNRAAAKLVTEHKIRYESPIYLSEVLTLWLRSGLRVIEFSSTYVGRQEGLSKLRMTDLVKAAVAIFEISSRYHIFGFPKRGPKVKPPLSTIE